jgi:hypothetical protein
MRLATVEIQLIMHACSERMLLAFARCNRHTYAAASHAYAWKHMPLLNPWPQRLHALTRFAKFKCIDERNEYSPLYRITQIRLYDRTNVYIDRVVRLTEMYHITLIELKYARIDDDRVEVLSSCLKKNNTITDVDLSLNCITGKGISFLVDALAPNTTLTSLRIRYNDYLDSDVDLFLNLLHHNSTITHLDCMSLHMSSRNQQRVNMMLAARRSALEV